MNWSRVKRELAVFCLLMAGTITLAACGGDDGLKATGSWQAVPGSTSPKLAELRILVDSLGTPSNSVIVREYVTAAGGLGREYGSLRELPQVATDVTLFYRDKLKAKGWEPLQEHAAVSAYGKGAQKLSILRYGPNLASPGPDQQTLVTAEHAVPLKFFFAIEVE